ncbi:MAG TPA: DUF5666 domain-containing protein [Candidatus Baltobacteraceae bacterium]
MKKLSVFVATGGLALAISCAQFATTAVPASAQTAQPRAISGTITAVSGHLVTVQRSTGSIVIDDQPALDNKSTGNVAVGRQVVAVGAWRDGTFYASSFADANVFAGSPPMPGTGTPRLRGFVRGTITAVSGHLVTLQRGSDSVVINDQPALNRKLTGSVAVGRDIAASGYWRGGTFYATTVTEANAATSTENGLNLGAFSHAPDSLSGTITGVTGSSVTLQQANRSLVVNDQPALNRKATGNVAVGRQVIANGYWLHGVFYVNSFDDASS